MATKSHSQLTDVLNHLQKKGLLTMPQGVYLYNIYRLGAIIFKLRDMGYNIKTELIPFVSRHQHKGSYAKYILVK